MLRALLITLISLLSLFASETQIVSVDKEKLSVEEHDQPKGKTGLILREYKEHQVILGYAKVVDSTTLNFQKYTNLQQDSFPTFDLSVEAGDRVVFGLYDSRVMLITPTRASYTELAEKYHDKELIHPDILAAYLLSTGGYNPKEKHLNHICQHYSVGLINFAIEDKLYEVDCLSLDVLNSEDIEKIDTKDQVLPFFHRIKEFKKGFWNFETPLTDYNSYYKKLLGAK
jgi:hypothetical protein